MGEGLGAREGLFCFVFVFFWAKKTLGRVGGWVDESIRDGGPEKEMTHGRAAALLQRTHTY